MASVSGGSIVRLPREKIWADFFLFGGDASWGRPYTSDNQTKKGGHKARPCTLMALRFISY